MDGELWKISQTSSLALLIYGSLLACAGCVTQASYEKQELATLRAHSEAVVRQAQTDTITLRQQLASMTVVAAKKEADLQDLHELVMQLRQNQAEADRVVLGLKQTLEGKETELARLREARVQLEMAQVSAGEKDQELGALQDALRTLTGELDQMKQTVNQLSARVSVREAAPSSRKPVAAPVVEPPVTGAKRVSALASASAQILPAVQIERGEEPSTGRCITVQPGDSLWKLARRYKVPVADLRKANDVAGDALVVGQELVIPRAPKPIKDQ